MTATTLGAQPSGLAGRGSSGGDAQERAATNPVAALPCARTPLLHPLSTPLLIPLLHPLSTPLLIPLLIPSTATVGVCSLTAVLFGQVGGIDPGRSRAKPARDRPGSLELWRATQSRLHAGASVPGRPPTNPVGGLPAGNRRHPGHPRWSDG